MLQERYGNTPIITNVEIVARVHSDSTDRLPYRVFFRGILNFTNKEPSAYLEILILQSGMAPFVLYTPTFCTAVFYFVEGLKMYEICIL